MALHDVVFEYLRKHITFKENNLNNYLLVKNNYLPVEQVSELRDNDSIILMAKN